MLDEHAGRNPVKIELNTMTPRHQEVLHGIVEAYIATGEPVASNCAIVSRIASS